MNTVKKTLTKLIALLTLAALMMSGATVTVLAEGLFDDTTDEAMADFFPDDEVFAEDEDYSDDEEIVACAVEETVSEMDFVMSEEGLMDISSADGEAEAMEEIADVEELDEISLGELTGEADPEDIEEGPEDRQQLMADLIVLAVEDRENEGLYAALNTTFATLADNADILANPETGVIETEGNEIINMTYEALRDHFGNSPEELMNAIGAAAGRATRNGYIDALGGDAALVSMAAQSSGKEAKYIAKYGKTIYDATVDALALSNPALKPFVSLLKTLGGEFFNVNDNSQAVQFEQIKTQLSAIEAQIKTTEQNLKDHMYNVISLANIANEYGDMAKVMETIRQDIGSYVRNPDLSDEKRTQLIADLCTDDQFRDLVTAVNGATNCFYAPVDIFENRNIFDATYNRACEEVMFSREAIDLAIPYLTRQLCTYNEAYALIGMVYDAYEEVYGENTLLEQRDVMLQRLYGVNLNGDKVGNSVMDKYLAFFQRNKYTFVNKSNCVNIRLDSQMVVPDKRDFKEDFINNSSRYSYWEKTPDYMKNNPLSDDQIKGLASYCAEKNVTLFEFLFNQMQFKPVVYSRAKAGCGINYTSFWEEIVDQSPVWFHYEPKGTFIGGEIYLVGNHSINKHQSGETCWLDYEGFLATKTDSAKKTVRVGEAWLSAASTFIGTSYYDTTPMFFQAW